MRSTVGIPAVYGGEDVKLHYQDFHAGTQYYQRSGKSINITSM
jgi:hypothetical protein